MRAQVEREIGAMCISQFHATDTLKSDSVGLFFVGGYHSSTSWSIDYGQYEIDRKHLSPI